jgi:hypothetical protein
VRILNLATVVALLSFFAPEFCYADIAESADKAGASALAGIGVKEEEIKQLDTEIARLETKKLAEKDKAKQEQIDSEIRKKKEDREEAYKQVDGNIESFKKSSELAAKARASDELNSEMNSAANNLKGANEAVDKAVQAHHEAVMEKTGLKPEDIGTEKWDQALDSMKSERAPHLAEINKAMDSRDAAQTQVTDLRDAAGQMAAADFGEKALAAYESASEGNYSQAASNAWEAVSGKNVETAVTGINALDGKFPEAAPLTPVASPASIVASTAASQAGVNLSGDTPTFTPSSGGTAWQRTATGNYQGGGEIQYFATGQNSGYAVYPNGEVFNYTGTPGSATLGTVNSATKSSAIGNVATTPTGKFASYTPYSPSSPATTTSTGVAAPAINGASSARTISANSQVVSTGQMKQVRTYTPAPTCKPYVDGSGVWHPCGG